MKYYLDLIEQTLTIPAAEYVPAIGDVFDIIKEARAALQQQEVPIWPVAQALSPRERELLTEVKVRLGEINLCQEWRDHAFAVLGRLAASPSTTRQQEAGSGPTHEQMMAGYAVACSFGVFEARAFDLAEQMHRALAAAPSTPENAGGVGGNDGR